MSEEITELPEREGMDYDVAIVGAGPAGLAAAIRLKQVAPDLSVVVIEKGSEPGAHILSGAVIDPIGLDRLLPSWRSHDEAPLKTQVHDDQFLLLSEKGGFRIPNILMPKLMNNHGNFIGSLGNVVRFLASEAEALGVEIYPGFAGAEILYGDNGEVLGVATGDMGVDRDGTPKDSFTRGMELRAKYTLFAEGARGSLSKQVLAKYDLCKNSDVQKFGIGFKELWRIPKEKHHPGRVQHSFGWPLQADTGGGSFLYHFEDGLVSVGFVVHLNYSNPTLSPFDEFQRFKCHPMVAPTLEGGERLAYGARALTEGGWQSVPKLVFPGGALIGCAAGFMNVPRIKGSHNAILSGMLAAEHVAAAIAEGRAHDEVTAYDAAWRASDIGRDLKPVRNVKPIWSKLGTYLGAPLFGLDMWTNELFGFSFFGTLKHGKPDYACLKPLSEVTPIVYQKLTQKPAFDKLSSVFVSNTNHEEDQPVHLKLADPSIPIEQNLPIYGEPARLYCPAGVYEVVYGDEEAKADPRFVINAQNCVHCKTCDIKDPAQNITWVPPEGGGGPNYPNM
ncbi:electron transfer flavoprotein-ubiquinone oxidoreductase [Methylocystis sp. MJC1]|jgi:electron-transferring-flavoprotein dehydrogenase|uniref:electron transfer flavoprotein-ubiquinone oxidoreductase n=1 Tax=Methylocystis sp. MJC1 TaxID=2654282 RepID=UPI0013EC5BD1|nr:electron transfer flavoprotein-ubiquinone oxidoreductase [Methylocystis sp. MJC1]KAF2990367.1 Electron transfer flavoprotein-ubiquinone oxidoreductase [Methylocystis sp. MJC1]MBU6528162.1 electron transfer flavoprotein-ubiquinone oxidoreductase [Methylocystis sp. MJC1]UZX11073.1 electron transfer flavoprotein-ubiquinone oxidoreductase [Methylocystis sp. MJC1]